MSTNTGNNQMNYGTISGLQSLDLDVLNATTVQADTLHNNKIISLDIIEANNVKVDYELELSDSGYITIGKGTLDEKNVTDTELSYLDGVTSSIQSQLNSVIAPIAQVAINTSNIASNLALINTNIGAIISHDMRIHGTEDRLDDVDVTVGTHSSQIATNISNIASNLALINTNIGALISHDMRIHGTEDRLDDVDVILPAHTTQINNNSSQIASNLANIMTNSYDIIYHASQLATHTSSIATNSSNIATNTSNIATHTTQIAAQTSNIATNATNITTNTTNIATHTTQIAAIKVKTDVIEAVTSNTTAQRHNTVYRSSTGVNVGSIGGNTGALYVSSYNLPMVLLPGTSTCRVYGADFYVGTDTTGRIIMTGTGNTIYMNGETQPQAYTSADHTAVSKIGLRSNPIGTVLAFAGNSVPAHHLLCNGQEVSQTTYASLYAVIGLLYSSGRTTSPSSGNFFVPQLSATYISGAGVNLTHTQKITNTTSRSVGSFEQMTVQGHSHTYIKSGSESAASGLPSTTVGSNNFTTTPTIGTTYDDGTTMGIGVTQPNNVAMNYIIQFE